MNHVCCEVEMQMLHKGIQCTCCQLALELGWLVELLHHIDVLQLAGLPGN